MIVCRFVLEMIVCAMKADAWIQATSKVRSFTLYVIDIYSFAMVIIKLNE